MSEQFQLDLLVGCRVYDSEGRKLGRVDEIRLVQEGGRYEVEGLLIGLNGLAERFGVAGPLERLEKWLRIRSWHVENYVIYWEQIVSIEEKAIHLKVPHKEIETMRQEER